MNTATNATITAAGRTYTLTERDGRQVLTNSLGKVTAYVSFNGRGEVLVLTAGTGILPSNWTEFDWNRVCNELEAMVAA